MTPLLESITVTNFRSVKGTITVPLSAPVVLIHGKNRSGKTSILSAIELSLTGNVPSLSRFVPDYASHLVHFEADESRMTVTVSDLGDTTRSTELAVVGSTVSGTPLLSPDQAHFFSERCYLAQATLSRLLEIYEHRDTRWSDSPLTRFVKDLLGLDQLDALVEGLHDSGDVRRVRAKLPEYKELSDTLPAIDRDITRLETELASIDDKIKAVNQRLLGKLECLGVQNPSTTPDADLRRIIEDPAEEPQLLRLARLRRNITATCDEWQAIRSHVDPIERKNAELASANANAALEAWRSSTGKRLENLFARLGDFFLDLPSPTSAGPEAARNAAVRKLRVELGRCTSVLAQDTEDTTRVIALGQDIGKAKDRVVVLDGKIARYSAKSSALAKVLASILEHIKSDDCPVCDRDYNECSSKPLKSHVSGRITELTKRAGRLQSLIEERNDMLRMLAETERERAGIVLNKLTRAARTNLQSRHDILENMRIELTKIAPETATGEQVVLLQSTTSRRLSEFRSRHDRETSIRNSAAQFSQDLGLTKASESEDLNSNLEQIKSTASRMESELSARQLTRRRALDDLHEREVLFARRTEVVTTIDRNTSRAVRLRESQITAGELIKHARDLRHRVRETRTRIVQRVFNESLNSVWHDLFVRLAPDEPFVPTFASPKVGDRPVEALLQTLYRSRETGANPRAVLSSGNLNTAALTLFLALHLSARPMLPWLVIDDPVQSMDEVHVAQFAALLRTLSKQHNRQVIIAVHEKPLFDYLALELSPAFQDDRLITVEISRTSSGTTEIDWKSLIWSPDPAILA